MALASNAYVFLRFHLRHFEQGDEHFEFVTPRELDQIGSRLRNESYGFIRTAVAGWIAGVRTAIPVFGMVKPTCLRLLQNQGLLQNHVQFRE